MPPPCLLRSNLASCMVITNYKFIALNLIRKPGLNNANYVRVLCLSYSTKFINLRDKASCIVIYYRQLTRLRAHALHVKVVSY